MLSASKTKIRSITTSVKLSVAGDVYKQLWKCATGGLSYSRRHRKKKSFTPIETDHINFGTEKVKWIGLNSAIPLKNDIKDEMSSMVASERRLPLKTIKDLDTFLTPHNLTLNISGYTNKSLLGRNVGYPVEIEGDDEFRDYESSVIMTTKQRIMEGERKRNLFRAAVIVGNKKGALGLGDVISPQMLKSVELARNKAIENLYHVPIYDGHTIIHSVAAKFSSTYIALDPRPRGYGVIAQRTICDICKLVGIQNLYAKIDGCTSNPVSIVKAFLRAVYSLETHQELADRTGCVVAATDLPNTSNLNYGIENGFIKVLALPSTKHVVEAENKRRKNLDDEFFNQASHYRGLHEPKDVSQFFQEFKRRPRPLKENKALKRLIEEGD